MNLGMKLIRMNLGMKLIFCVLLGIYKFSPFILAWSGKPGPFKVIPNNKSAT